MSIHIKRLVTLILIVMTASFLLSSYHETAYADSSNAMVVGITTTLNVRSTPNGSVITTITNGTRVQVLSESGDWYQVTFEKSGTTYTGYVSKMYISRDASSSADQPFETQIADFPESYKPYLRSLHQAHPSWVFHADNTGADWSAVLSAETSSGTSLVPLSSDRSWLNLEIQKVVDAPNWVNASSGIVSYYLDPRNMLNDSYIMQFADLRYADGSISETAIALVLKGSFMSGAKAAYAGGDSLNYFQLFAIAGNDAAEGSQGINPIFLAAHSIQEVGYKGSSASNGSTGFYNFYNIGAYSDSINASRHGLTLAQNGLDDAFNRRYNIPWNTPGKSIVYGGKWIYDNYTNKGQYTLYYMRFNVSPSRSYSLCKHQYMTALQSVASEGNRMYEAYKQAGILETTIHFYIPVYNNMPGECAAMPQSLGVTGYPTPEVTVPVNPDGAANGFSLYNSARGNDIPSFVTRLYNLALRRNPDRIGYLDWTNRLYNGSSGKDVAYGFIFSNEMLNSGISNEEFVRRMYWIFLDREPDSIGYADWTGRLAAGQPKMAIFEGFVYSVEFQARCRAAGIRPY